MAMANYYRLHFYICSLILLVLSLSSLHIIHPVHGSSSATGSGGGGGGGATTRHSYSLSTFSPNGEIDQIVRAMRASMLGLPLLVLSGPPSFIDDEEEEGKDDVVDHASTLTDAVISSSSSSMHSAPRSSQGCKGGGIYLCLPQRYLSTSPLCIDTGTPHILQLTSSICLSHTGISADGRSLLDYATELTLDYRYVYGVEMPLQELLMGLADKMMERTRRAGWRPYGCALLVMSLGEEGNEDERPTMYRVDPSGVVVLLNPRSPQSRIHDDIDVAGNNDDARGSVVVAEQDSMRKSSKQTSPSSSSAAFLGNWDAILPRHEMDDIRERLEQQASVIMSEEEIQKLLAGVVGRTFADTDPTTDTHGRSSSEIECGERPTRHRPMLFASFTRERGLQISRIE